MKSKEISSLNISDGVVDKEKDTTSASSTSPDRPASDGARLSFSDFMSKHPPVLKLKPDDVIATMKSRRFVLLKSVADGAIQTYTNQYEGPGGDIKVMLDVYLTTDTYHFTATLTPGILFVGSQMLTDVMNEDRFYEIYNYVRRTMRKILAQNDLPSRD